MKKMSIFFEFFFSQMDLKDKLRYDCACSCPLLRYSRTMFSRIVKEAFMVQWLFRSHCKPSVAGSIPGFSGLSDETINRGPVSI